MTTYTNSKLPHPRSAESSAHKESYFAARNTASGFISGFESIFANVSQKLILKGGPGTGKSTLIRAVAAEAENRGLSVEYFYCSSDTRSLDGVLIGDGKIAVLDGTSPHTVDARVPGIRDEIVNLGQFWNSKMLRESSGEIRYYLDTISSTYKSVYDAMSIAASAEKLIERLILKHTDLVKMEHAAERLARAYPSDGAPSRERFLSAFGVHGYVFLDSYEKRAEEIYTFRDRYCISHVFLDMLKEKLTERHIGFDISQSPVYSQSDALILNSARVAFLPSAATPGKVINTERFIDRGISAERDEIRQLRAISSSALRMAEKKLSYLGELHDELESIYIGAMDFKGISTFTRRLLVSIFKSGSDR